MNFYLMESNLNGSNRVLVNRYTEDQLDDMWHHKQNLEITRIGVENLKYEVYTEELYNAWRASK